MSMHEPFSNPPPDSRFFKGTRGFKAGEAAYLVAAEKGWNRFAVLQEFRGKKA
jgi:hypothetical protein